MSDFFFFDSGDAPQPRERVQITQLDVTPYPDGSRVRLQIEMTPFLEHPNLEIYLKRIDGPIVSEMSVIESMQHVLEFTLHIRGVEDFAGDYLLTVELFYEERTSPQHVREVSFTIDDTP